MINILSEILVTAFWIWQLCYVFAYRFSHTGKVCAGDYAELEVIQGQATVADDKFAIFYMREEGDFLYYYVVCCVCFAFVVIGAACCVGSCMFMGGSVSALSAVEQMLKQLE